MSHSTVLVIGPIDDEQLTEALAPFDENIIVPSYKDYVGPLPDGWEVTIKNRETFGRLQDAGVERRAAWEQVWGEVNDDPHVPFAYTYAMDNGIDPTDPVAVAAFHNARDEPMGVDENGLYEWSTYNKKSRWDWWQLGGRWAGSLRLRPGVEPLVNARGEASWGFEEDPYVTGKVDRAIWSTIDWERMGAEQVEELRSIYRARQGREPSPWDVPIAGLTEDEYVRRNLGFSTYAILTPEGEWLERGKMGWWGLSSDEKSADRWQQEWRSIVDQHCDDDTIVSVVDVHV